MHEFSIATQIVDSVLEFFRDHPPGEVLAVRLQIGELTCVDPEQLGFCYESITRGTNLEGSHLEFDTIAAAVACSHCSFSGPPKYWDDALATTRIPTLQCPQCGKGAEATQGHECIIKSLQVYHQDDVLEPAVPAGRESP